MANRYVDVSAANNGDGTASNQAASPGVAGAWNNLENVLKGTPGYGTLAAGDTVFVRTKNGSNLSQTLSGSTAITINTLATKAAPINWVFDDGSVWFGGNGIFTLTVPGFTLNLTDYNNIRAGNADNRRLIIHNTYSGTAQIKGCNFGTAIYDGVYFESEPSTGTRLVYFGHHSTFRAPILNDCYFNVRSCNGLTYFPLFSGSDNCCWIFNNPTINKNNLVNQLIIFNSNGASFTLVVNGGQILNATVSDFVFQHGGTSYFAQINGMDIGNCQPVVLGASNTLGDRQAEYLVFALSSRKFPFDFYVSTPLGFYEWWQNQNYPTLNTTLPDGTPWSVRITPRFATAGIPVSFSKISKIYTGTASTKTLTFEFLLESKYTSPKSNQYWVSVLYVDDATGLTRRLTSFNVNGTAISGSSAAWSTVLHGDPTKTFSKWKIELVTPTAIKQYSQVRAEFHVGEPPQQLTDYLFLDPDFTVT